METRNRIVGYAGHGVAIVAVLALTACDAVNDAVNEVRDIGSDAEVLYYVSVGTSLSVGVQPDSNGLTLPTDDGYPDLLHDSIEPLVETVGNRELRLVKFGCPGETLDTFVDGGDCPYIAGSQLAAAVDFLEDNRGSVYLVTIDMGANDFRNAGCIGTEVDPACVDAVGLQIAGDLAEALATLRNAAGPDTPIVGMNYYNPYLASWLDGPAGQELAVAAALAVGGLNAILGTTYETAGMPVADVAMAFESDDFVTLVDSSQPPPNQSLPLNVNNICEYTFMCEPEPTGPDIHAKDAGYALIAETFLSVVP